MYLTSLCAPVALIYLFLAFLVTSNAQNAGVGEEEARLSVAAGAPLEVQCRLRPEQRAEWKLDGAQPPADLESAPEAPAPDGRLTARLRAAAARAHHAGLYTCSTDGRRGPRVRVAVLPPAPEAAADAEPEPASAAAGAATDSRELFYDVRYNITLHCSLPNVNNLSYVWTKNDTNIEEVSDLKGRYRLERDGVEFLVDHSVEDDFGNYTCALREAGGGAPSGDGAVLRWAVRGRTLAKLPADSNVVEGQKLKLQCKVLGKPYPRVIWTFSNSSEEGVEGVEVRAALGERVTLRRSEQGAEDGELVLEAVRRADAGRYACAAPVLGALAPPLHTAATTLHVKDMYAALWPFLGICAEVFVLCAIILVYEKRRTKPELDDSDTDNHDQKKS